MQPLSRQFLLDRGFCCGYGCLNCPYDNSNKTMQGSLKEVRICTKMLTPTTVSQKK